MLSYYCHKNLIIQCHFIRILIFKAECLIRETVKVTSKSNSFVVCRNGVLYTFLTDKLDASPFHLSNHQVEDHKVFRNSASSKVPYFLVSSLRYLLQVDISIFLINSYIKLYYFHSSVQP